MSQPPTGPQDPPEDNSEEPTSPYGDPSPGQAYSEYGNQPTYGFPAQDPYQQQQPPPPPPRRKWLWVAAGVAALVAIGVAVLLGIALGSNGNDKNQAAPSASPSVAPPSATSAPASAAPTTQSAPTTGQGLPTDGILKVGSDIQPGEYRITPVDARGGYWERLSCLTGDFDCIIANDNVSGTGYLSVLPSDVAVKIQNLRLTRTGAAIKPQAPTGNAVAPDVGGTDAQGFVGDPAARCNGDNDAAAVGRTANSLVVVCETGVGRYYYKGERTADGSAVEIDDPVRNGADFVATNNGIQYTISSDALVISKGGTVLSQEPMLEYWAG